MRQNNSNVILARVHTSLQILFIREKKRKHILPIQGPSKEHPKQEIWEEKK